jgi:hypothetical protein
VYKSEPFTVRLPFLLSALCLSACTPASPKDTGAGDTASDSGTDTDTNGGGGECVSGDYWTGGNEESPMMNPGEACIACHTEEREGPQFAIAGTVFTNFDEPDDCNGVDGATVRITDANGDTYEARSNRAGNFFLDARNNPIATPYFAEVVFGDGTVATMGGARESGDCNSCHTQYGSGGAPGRIASSAAN